MRNWKTPTLVTLNLAVLLATRPLAFGGDQTPLTEVALFNRCYMHLTQRKVAANDPRMVQVKAGTLSAVDACMQVFDQGQLVASGASEGTLVNNSNEAKWVLQTFNEFHRSWFPNDNLALSVPGGVENHYRTAKLHDETEPALHVTRALLTNGVPFSTIVTGTEAMEALRSFGPDPYEATATADQKLKTKASASSTSIVDLNAQLVQTGELLGVRRMSLNASKNGQIAFSSGRMDTGTGESASEAIPVHQSLGGGILGTKSYLMLNLGRPNYEGMDGGLRMPRVWTKAIFNNLLCRDLPVIRTADAQAFVQPPAANRPPFRTNVSCMECHATMDLAARSARNVTYVAVPGPYDGPSTMNLYKWRTTLSTDAGTVDRDYTYYQQPTNGTLLYRSYDGTLISRSVTGIPALGNELAASNDLYACAANRYFKHFTGVQANLQDIGNTALTPLNADELAYRNMVIQLGQSLKTGNNLRQLVQSIIGSPLYRSQSMRLPRP